MPEPVPADEQDNEVLQRIYHGKLDNLPSLASKIVRIFTSSTFTGIFSIHIFLSRNMSKKVY